MAFEGQAAMLLEGLADRHGAEEPAGQLLDIDDGARSTSHRSLRGSRTSATPAMARRCSTRR